MAEICAGLNVIEIGSASIAASMTGMVLADAGARVVKVELADGDRLRTVNPNGFLVWNRGKESVVADLRTEEGRGHFHEWVAAADVLIEGFAPGTMDRWGLGAEALRAANPRLVHCRITGFGQTGPLAGIKGYDSLVAARAGLWARGDFGHRSGAILYPVPWASYGAAMQAVAGILGALLVRDRTGRGQVLDATMWSGLEPLDYLVSVVAQVVAKRAEQGDSGGGGSPPSRYGVLLVTKDGRFVQTSTLLPHQGRALCRVADIEAILDEPRFAQAPMFATADDAQAFEDALLEAFREHDLDHWLPLLLASPDVAFEVAVTSEEGLAHPQIEHNGDVITIEDPDVGPVRQVGPIGHFSRTPMEPRRSAPVVGANAGPLTASPATDPIGDRPGPHPFSGITIVEFGFFYAMPYALTMAAALGARVIKIEDASGDPYRTAFGPELASTKTTAGKESVSLDLRTERGRAIAKQIVARADVFVTSFRSGVADRLGLGEAGLRALNPRLLYVHAAGYGSDGPYAHRALYAQAAQAVAGSFSRQVAYWADPAKNVDLSLLEVQVIVLPRLAQVIDGDANAALGLLAALALGLYHQARTGEGQVLRTSMIAGNAWVYSDDFCSYEGKVPVPLCDDDYHGTSALDRVYPAADGTWLCLHVPTDEEFAALAEVLDGQVADDRFVDGSARRALDADLVAALAEAFTKKAAGEWQAELSATGVGCAEVSMLGHAPTVAFDPLLQEMGLTVTFEHPLFGELVRAAPPITFSESAGRVEVPCRCGEQSRAVLAELGYAVSDIDEFEAAGIISSPSAS